MFRHQFALFSLAVDGLQHVRQKKLTFYNHSRPSTGMFTLYVFVNVSNARFPSSGNFRWKSGLCSFFVIVKIHIPSFHKADFMTYQSPHLSIPQIAANYPMQLGTQGVCILINPTNHSFSCFISSIIIFRHRFFIQFS